MKLLILFSLFLFTLCCAQSSKRIDLKFFKGSWYCNEGVMFNTLKINDSTIFVDNKADTIFTMKYAVIHDLLIMWHPHNNTQFKNKIILLTKDSLVLDGIATLKMVRRYSRVRSK
jgi:hypothetical protein